MITPIRRMSDHELEAMHRVAMEYIKDNSEESNPTSTIVMVRDLQSIAASNLVIIELQARILDVLTRGG